MSYYYDLTQPIIFIDYLLLLFIYYGVGRINTKKRYRKERRGRRAKKSKRIEAQRVSPQPYPGQSMST